MDVFLFLDGGVTGLKAKLANLFADSSGKVMAKKQRDILVVTDEDSLRERKKCVKGTIDQVEHMVVISAVGTPEMPNKRRLAPFSGTNMGCFIGQLIAPPLSELWIGVQPEDRKAILGDALKAIGGPGVEPSTGRVYHTHTHPVFWHSMDPMFFKELQHAYILPKFINLSTSDGGLELAMLEANVPTISVCINESHQAALIERLEAKIVGMMMNSTNRFYDARLAAVLGAQPANLPGPSASSVVDVEREEVQTEPDSECPGVDEPTGLAVKKQFQDRLAALKTMIAAQK